VKHPQLLPPRNAHDNSPRLGQVPAVSVIMGGCSRQTREHDRREAVPVASYTVFCGTLVGFEEDQNRDSQAHILADSHYTGTRFGAACYLMLDPSSRRQLLVKD
jgi:hypothetical protein